MEDLLWLLKTSRRAESLLLPLFPKQWRQPPPSYRMAAPLIAELEKRQESHAWISPVLFMIRKNYYRAYHQDGLAIAELLPAEASRMRLISAIAIVVLILAVSPWAPSISPWIKGSLLWGGSMLLLHSTFQLRTSVLWATWGLLFQPVVYPSAGSPWAGLFITGWLLLWHGCVQEIPSRWRWYDVAATIPTLFFWLFATKSWLESFPIWQSGILATALWILCWILIFRGPKLLHSSLLCLWPASFTAALVVAVFHSRLKRYGLLGFKTWLFWLLVSVALGFLLSRVAPFLRRLRFLQSIALTFGVFATYAALLAITKKPGDVVLIIDMQFRILYLWSWPIWWIAGAGVVFYARKLAMLLFQWLQVFLSSWTLPLAAWGAIGWALWGGRFSHIQSYLGTSLLICLCLAFAVGTTVLAWREKETGAREWLFAGFFIFFLIDQYFSQIEHVVASLDTSPPLGTIGFLGLAIGLLWMSFDFIGERLRDFARNENALASISTVGCALFFLLGMLWISYVDRRFLPDQSYTLEGNIGWDMSVGLTLLGIPMLIYLGAARLEGLSGPPRSMPWFPIILAGVVPAQLLQGLEHYAAAWIGGASGTLLHKGLIDAMDDPAAQEALAPALVNHAGWVLAWHGSRWLISMILCIYLSTRNDDKKTRFQILVATSFASLAVGTAEFTSMAWPAMPAAWSVVLRPWQIKTAVWDLDFLKFYAIYGLSGLAFGWILSRRVGSQTPGPAVP